MLKEFTKWAENNGWNVVIVDDKAELPDHIMKRYKIPESWYEFIARMRVCQNKDYTKWFFTPWEYQNSLNPGFRWNEQVSRGRVFILRHRHRKRQGRLRL